MTEADPWLTDEPVVQPWWLINNTAYSRPENEAARAWLYELLRRPSERELLGRLDDEELIRQLHTRHRDDAAWELIEHRGFVVSDKGICDPEGNCVLEVNQGRHPKRG
jgi:hypothetical protein